MTQLTCWRITLWMNPFVFGVPFPVFVPSLPLFESIFSAVTILYFVPMHTYLSCHCKHQWQSLYSFICFSFTILFVFHTSVCLKAGGFDYHFSFIPPHFFFFLCRHCSFLYQYFLCFPLRIFSSSILSWYLYLEVFPIANSSFFLIHPHPSSSPGQSRQ